MATEELLRNLPCTEDLHRLVLEWLDRMESEHTVEQTGETNKDAPGKGLAGNGSTATRGGPSSDGNGSTALRGELPSIGNGTSAYGAGPPAMKTGRQPHEASPTLARRVGSHMWQTTKKPGQRYNHAYTQRGSCSRTRAFAE